MYWLHMHTPVSLSCSGASRMAAKVSRIMCMPSFFYRRSFQNLKGTILLTLNRKFSGYERDPAPLFFNPEVQGLMRKLTNVDVKKITRNRKCGGKLEPPEYKFMTTEELEQCLKEANEKIEKRLQVPPIVKEQEEINEILSEDKALTGYDSARFVFTDITFGVSSKDRIIVVREPNGVLRKAHWNERFRMNQIYFPEPYRQIHPPHMFEEPYLSNVLDKGEYEFILDRACVQYEPNDPEFHRITSTTYEHIEKEQKFELLQSTRHYGALAFYLSWNKRIDKFILHYIQNNRLEDAVLLIKLFHLLNPEAKSAKSQFQDSVQFVQAFIDMDSSRKSVLELALQSYIELQKEQLALEEGIKKAHGV